MRGNLPYVGITGFKYREQVEAVRTAVIGERRLMVGVLASQRTLMHRESKPDGRSPKAENIAAIFPPGRQTLNLVHYYTEDQITLADQLTAVRYFGGPNCHGVQLNIAWPDREVLLEYQRDFPETVMVLQLGGRRWALTDYEPSELADKVMNLYGNIADVILLDPSGGLGKEMDVNMLLPYVECLERGFRHRLAVAGGLHADNLELIRPLCDQFPGLSFDAEGKLHSGPGQLDLDHCQRYLQVASTLPV